MKIQEPVVKRIVEITTQEKLAKTTVTMVYALLKDAISDTHGVCVTCGNSMERASIVKDAGIGILLT